MWMSVDGLASYLLVSKETVYRMIYQGDLPKHRLGKLWRFHSQEVDSWIRSHSSGDKSRKKGTSSTRAKRDVGASRRGTLGKVASSSPRKRSRKSDK